MLDLENVNRTYLLTLCECCMFLYGRVGQLVPQKLSEISVVVGLVKLLSCSHFCLLLVL